MGKLHSQLALFGSLDDEVMAQKDPHTSAVVESFLPGTTGYGQRGWFGQLKTFVNKLATKQDPVHFPSREEALADLTRDQRPSRAFLDDLDPERILDLVTSGPDEESVLTPVESAKLMRLFPTRTAHLASAPPATGERLPAGLLARAVYAGAIINQLHPPAAPREAAATVKLMGPGVPTRLHLLHDDSLSEDPLTTLMGMAAPPPPTRIDTARIRFRNQNMLYNDLQSYAGRFLVPNPGDEFRWATSKLTSGRAGYQRLMAESLAEDSQGPVRNEIARYPLPCTGAVRKIDGQLCTVLTTVIEDPRSLEEITDVLVPVKWSDVLQSFFCAMEDRDKNPDTGWSRVLECVSTECSEYQLKTALKYWNAARGQRGFFLNYDLDDDRTGDSGLVEVDSGYIWITPNETGGVRIKTSKALRICGLSPTATAALACYSGWAQVGVDMVVNAAKEQKLNAGSFTPSAAPVATAMQRPGRHAKVEKPAKPHRTARLPDLPVGFRRDMVEDAAAQANTYIAASVSLAKDFSTRWSDGLTRTDMREFGQRIGNEFSALAAESFDSALGNFQPDPTEPSPFPAPDREECDD